MNGIIKGRTCANEGKQQMYLKEGESVYFQALSLNGMIVTLLIGAYEGK